MANNDFPAAIPMHDPLQFGRQALHLRAARQEVLASNLANSDTPYYKARDIDFATVLQERLAGGRSARLNATHPAHFRSAPGGEWSGLQYRRPLQGSLDANTVDPDFERAQFAENAMMTESAIAFLNATIRSRMSAITGQSS